jgi:hypothetical protein
MTMTGPTAVGEAIAAERRANGEAPSLIPGFRDG